MGRKRKYTKPIWKYDHNIDTPTNDTKLVQLYHSQLVHKNFISLSSSAKTVYIYMLDYSNGKIETSFPYRIYKTFITKPTFIKSIKELTDKGFIETVENGRFTRTENKYKFLCKWCE